MASQAPPKVITLATSSINDKMADFQSAPSFTQLIVTLPQIMLRKG